MRMKYTKDGILDISKINEEVSIDFRLFILNMIKSCFFNVAGEEQRMDKGSEAIKLDKR